jgi:signal transduction histidine kinase
VLELIQDLLSASANHTGKLELKPVVQDPTKLCARHSNRSVLIARKKGIQVVWEVPSSLPSAELDPVRVTEVLSNLISNGVKFCSPGQSVALGARPADSALEIFVRDNGPEIKEDELPHLFDPVQQAFQ